MTVAATGTITSAGAVVDHLTPIEDAIQAWVVAGSQLAADHVIWAGERGAGPAPAGTYISLRFIASNRVSMDWIKAERAGSSVIFHVRGTRHPTLEITCSAGANYGSRRAEQIIERVLTAIKLPSVAKSLRAGGVGVGTRGPVRVVPGIRSQMLDPRAIVEVGLHIMIDISEHGSSIEHVGLETPGALTTTVDQP